MNATLHSKMVWLQALVAHLVLCRALLSLVVFMFQTTIPTFSDLLTGSHSLFWMPLVLVFHVDSTDSGFYSVTNHFHLGQHTSCSAAYLLGLLQGEVVLSKESFPHLAMLIHL